MGAIKQTKWTPFICQQVLMANSFLICFLFFLIKLHFICMSTITLPLRFNKILICNTKIYKLNKDCLLLVLVHYYR